MNKEKVEIISSSRHRDLWREAIEESQAAAARTAKAIEAVTEKIIELLRDMQVRRGKKLFGQTTFRIEGESRHDGGINDGIKGNE